MASAGIRKFLQANTCFDADIEKVLTESGISEEDDLCNVTEKQWDEMYRQINVIRRGDTKDTASNQRLEKKLLKLKAIWRKKSGIKATNIKKKKGGGSAAAAKDPAGSRAVREDALARGRDLKKFMQANGFWEIELCIALVHTFDVTNEDEIPTNVDTQDKFDEVIRLVKVARRGDTKDTASAQRLEKLLAKFEAHWRKVTGIKKTNIKKKKKSKKGASGVASDDEKTSSMAGGGGVVSKSMRDEALKRGRALKKFMQANGFWEIELCIALVITFDVTNEEEIPSNVDSQDKFDEVIRLVKVARRGDTKDTASAQRLEKLLAKFEAHWRKATGIKKTNIKKKSGKKKAKRAASPGPAGKSAKSQDVASMASDDGRALKKWMQAEDVWELALYQNLLKNGITSEDDLKHVGESTFDEIVRVVRVDRFTTLKDQQSRNRLDKKLVKFERLWRKASGIKKTSIKKKSKK